MTDLKKQLLGGAAGVHLKPGDLTEVKTNGPEIKRPRVMIALPSGRTWEARTATAVAGMATFSALHGVEIAITNLEGSMISKQRNDLAAMAIQHNMDYIMWVDTDMLMPPDAMIRLLKHQRDVVGATYNKRVPPYETLGRLKGPKPDKLGGLLEADLMPGGFMLVKTDVYRRIGWPYYWETYQWPGDTGVARLKNYLRNSWHDAPSEAELDSLELAKPLVDWLQKQHDADVGNPKWEYYSEDLNFCRKLRKAGITIWCDLDLTFQMAHLGTLEVTCRPPAEEQQVEGALVPAPM